MPRYGTAKPVPRETKFSSANGDMDTFKSVQLTASRFDNLTQLIHTLLHVMTIHTYIIHTHVHSSTYIHNTYH